MPHIRFETDEFLSQTTSLDTGVVKRFYTAEDEYIWLYTVDTEQIRYTRIYVEESMAAKDRAQKWISAGALKVEDVDHIRGQ